MSWNPSPEERKAFVEHVYATYPLMMIRAWIRQLLHIAGDA